MHKGETVVVKLTKILEILKFSDSYKLQLMLKSLSSTDGSEATSDNWKSFKSVFYLVWKFFFVFGIFTRLSSLFRYIEKQPDNTVRVGLKFYDVTTCHQGDN